MSNVKGQDSMIVDILQHIDAGICDVGEIAESLGVDPGEVRERIQVMGMLGFLQAGGSERFDPTSRGCMACGMSRVCGTGTSPAEPADGKTYTITGKGRYLLEKWDEAGR